MSEFTAGSKIKIMLTYNVMHYLSSFPRVDRDIKIEEIRHSVYSLSHRDVAEIEAAERSRSRRRSFILFDNIFGVNFKLEDIVLVEDEVVLEKKVEEEKDFCMNKIKSVLEGIYSNPELRKSIVPLFLGNPGLGKTKIIEQFAKEKGVQLVEFITSQMSPFEISGIAIPDKEVKKMVYYNFDKLESLKDGDILFFDELLNGNPTVLNACLTVLEQRKMISGMPLPDIMIVAAANPQGAVPLTPQIKERFVWYDVKFHKSMWIDYMIEKYKITRSIGEKLSTLITREDFIGSNYCTPRSVDKAVNMLIKNIDTPYSGKVLPYLEELIQNTSDKPIKLTDEKEFLPGEMLKWIDLIRYDSYIVVKPKRKYTRKKKVEEPVVVSSGDAIDVVPSKVVDELIS